MLIGLISDTHLPSSIRDLWPEVTSAFQNVDLILHAGDIVAPRILDRLEDIAPVVAALGNADFDMEDPRVQPVQRLEYEGWKLCLIHNSSSGLPMGGPLDILISGHTHFEYINSEDNVLYINPGSATLPHQQSTRLGTVGFLDLNPTHVSASVVRLGDGPVVNGELLLNPGTDLRFRHERK